MSKNILVTGANGQLGKALRYEFEQKGLGNQVVFTDLPETDICSPDSIRKLLKHHKPRFLINCAAYTAVDKAETESAEAFRINATAPAQLADICSCETINLIHISTDYVFDGKANTPYKEESPTNPISEYGKSKLAGEQAVLKSRMGTVIRTSWLYSLQGNNFLNTILKHARTQKTLRVVFDQTGTPTWANDLARAIISMIGTRNPSRLAGLYHFSNEGVCSWYDFARAIVSLSDIPCEIIPIETKDYPTPAPRPQYTVLNKQKIKEQHGVEVPYWLESLTYCLKNFNPEKQQL